ncbi:MAG: DNA adenine methylase [Muribaculaceae bacterium]|nr:DNA adenine methylase [Muribaculaceae bacterium]
MALGALKIPTFQHDLENMGNLTLYEAISKFGESVIESWRTAAYQSNYRLESRRYIGCKAKLVDWIFDIIESETEDVHSFCDIFAGTGSVANRAFRLYDRVLVNDFLFSNNIIYKAFFQDAPWRKAKVLDLLDYYNSINPDSLTDNYFSINFGDKFFDMKTSRLIGYIREDLESKRTNLTEKEFAIILASLIYSIDRLANTLGHYEAYIKKAITPRKLILRMIDVNNFSGAEIFQEDSNQLARKIHADVVYIDPPYNSRQYSRFYHLLENLVQWTKPALFGVAMKPKEENMSAYCRSSAFAAFQDLIAHIDARYLIVSYNNTYKSKSSSSENKIKLEQIEEALNKCGDTHIFEHAYSPFNSGKTEFEDHKEYLFVTHVNHERRDRAFSTILRGR